MTSEGLLSNAPPPNTDLATMALFNSFKKDDSSRPLMYRTPSPPTHAIEPLSPSNSYDTSDALGLHCDGGWRGGVDQRQLDKRNTDETESEPDDEVVGVPVPEAQVSSSVYCHSRKPSTMDDFATIALASSPSFARPVPHTAKSGVIHLSGHWKENNGHPSERPLKRARSEKCQSPESQRSRSRPATSHLVDTNLQSDAELLLFLHQYGGKSSARTMSRTLHTTINSDGPSASYDASPSPRAPISEHLRNAEYYTTPQRSRSRQDQKNGMVTQTGRHQDLDEEHHRVYDSLGSYQSDFTTRAESQPGHGAPNIRKDIEGGTIAAGSTMVDNGIKNLSNGASNHFEDVEVRWQATSRLGKTYNVSGDGPSSLESPFTQPHQNPRPHAQETPPAADGVNTDNLHGGAQIVDKGNQRESGPTHPPTTYLRKSSRAHTAIDYVGLNEGVVKTSDENPEHHYIRPIKEGTIKFLPDNFPRMRPELVDADFFEKGDGMKEPVVIPASMNPRPPSPNLDLRSPSEMIAADSGKAEDGGALDDVPDDWWSRDYDYEYVADHGQDALDMVIPRGLTVPRVGALYGMEEKVEVIDVKSQEGEDKKWNMRRWVDYYQTTGVKKVRNVISLEVSQSKLGRLIKRPKIVRQLDLQDSVWPEEAIAKGDFPKVQLYCLMSVADCYTDFHIDFGGSSVFYHILKGKKTFLFIPPKERHLKKYEDWCMSQTQNWTFLGDLTKECYRVDLSEGDTMLIPSGWIHAVWTPENSLVIGGNFLTRMHYGMQIRIAQIEKATKVARKFRYPHFQKLLWYTAIRYLERDPIPLSVVKAFCDGQKFFREMPSYYEFSPWESKAKPGDETYHSRYYSQYELEGLPDLARYLLRTALISMGKIADGITADTRNAVKRSIPKGYGEPLDIVKRFAMWLAWKRGNEYIPHWAHPDAIPGDDVAEPSDKKPSAAALRRIEREAAMAAYRVAPERQSARKLSQLERANAEAAKSPVIEGEFGKDSPAPGESGQPMVQGSKKRVKGVSKSSVLGPRRVACEKCRKRRIRCKHKDEVGHDAFANPKFLSIDGTPDGRSAVSLPSKSSPLASQDESATNRWSETVKLDPGANAHANGTRSLHMVLIETQAEPDRYLDESKTPANNAVSTFLTPAHNGQTNSEGSSIRRRSRACDECRKSKVSCM